MNRTLGSGSEGRFTSNDRGFSFHDRPLPPFVRRAQAQGLTRVHWAKVQGVEDADMPKLIPVLLAFVLAVLLGGSSCNSHNDAPQPPYDDGAMGYKLVPSQQVIPQVQSTPMPRR